MGGTEGQGGGARPRLAIVGCGDLGARCGRELLTEGWEVHGLRRSPGRLPAEFIPHGADYTRAGGLDCLATLEPDCLLVTFNPAGAGLEGYRSGYAGGAAELVRALGAQAPRLVLLVSSTRVYAERDGGWVDESSPLERQEPRALALVEMERRLQAAFPQTVAVRLAGIYGGAGGRLLDRVARGEIAPAEPLRYGNRIHREDCGGFLAHLLLAAQRGAALEPVYNGVDDLPTPQHEVEQWLAGQLGVTAVPGAGAGERGGGHKRCRNRLLHASGYRLRYPDYRSGYAAMLRARERGR